MAIRDKSERPRVSPIEIDISGPAGNAYAMIGCAINLAKQLEYTQAEIDELDKDMTSGDYDHLIEVFDTHFGRIVTLWK